MVFKYSLFPALLIAVVSVLGLYLVSERINIVLVFIPGVIISFFLFGFASRRLMQSFPELLPLYILALGIHMLHLFEEFISGFYKAMPALLGDEPYPLTVWLGFNLVADTVFIMGAFALIKEIKAMYVIVIFFILYGVCFNGLAHLLTSIYVQGYFPGLYTALLYLIIGPLMVRKILKSSAPV